MDKKDLRLVALGALLVAVAGMNLLAITDPVESNYTLTAKEMLASGDFISPRIYGKFWYDKPIFFYWELIASFAVFGVNEFAARFFPVVFSLLNAATAFWFGKKLYGEKVGAIAAMIFASTVAFFYLSKAVITDMTFVFFFNATLIAFYQAYVTGNRKIYLLSFFFAGLGTLTKGPIGILMPGLILLIFLCVRRRPKELLHMMWIPGLIIFAAVGGYWYYQMYQLHGQDFILNFFGVHNFLRATVSEHPRDDVFWYYTMIFFAGFFPWSFLMVYKLKKKWKELRAAAWREDVIFLLIWVGVVNIAFQLMATKYITYTQPSFLPFALLAALLLKDSELLVKRVFSGFVILYVALTFLVAVPMCQEHSGKAIAQALHDLNPEETVPVVSFGDYSTSAVYYYGDNIRALGWYEDNEAHEPSGISWNAKNVMPHQAIENLPIGEPVYVVCLKRRYDVLQKTIPHATFEVVHDTPQHLIVKVVLSQKETKP